MRRHIYDKFTTILFISVLLFAHTACKSSSGRMKSPSRPDPITMLIGSGGGSGGGAGGSGSVLGGVGDDNEFDYEDDYYFIIQELNKNKSNTTNNASTNLQRRIIPDEQRLMTKILRMTKIIIITTMVIIANKMISNNNSQQSTLNRRLNESLEMFTKNLKSYLKRQQIHHVNKNLQNECKLIALIVDRLLFWIFTFITLISSIVLLVVVPLMKNKINDFYYD
jgi:hypothetical protein